MKSKITELRSKGETYTNIAKILNCSRSLVCYHLGKNAKEKSTLRHRKYIKNQHPYFTKLSKFKNAKSKIDKYTIVIKRKYTKIIYQKLQRFVGESMKNSSLKVKQIIDKFGENPKCYLTGKTIDIYRTDTYHFDHVIPITRGGTNTIDNLQIASAEVNLAKRNMTPEEFLSMCKQVVEFYGRQNP